MNHTRFPKEDHLPDWARWDNKVMKGDRAEYKWWNGNYLELKSRDLIQILPLYVSGGSGKNHDTRHLE